VPSKTLTAIAYVDISNPRSWTRWCLRRSTASNPTAAATTGKNGSTPTFDSTGLAEAFHRGDRIYDLRDVRFEWQTRELDDAERTADYHAQVDRLVADSAEIGRRLGDSAEPGGTLGDDDVARLRALGYVGLADGADAPDAPEVGDSDATAVEIHTRPPLIDRSRLHRGDRHLWEILRRQKVTPDAALPPAFRRRIAAARSDYAAFLVQHPDREMWVYWRIAMLDDATNRIRAAER
jgi:hypothetical protein